MMKRYSLIVVLLFLAFITTACGPVTTDYNIRNGKEIDCTPKTYPSTDNGNDGTCTWPYYESVTDDGNVTSLVTCYSYPVYTNTPYGIPMQDSCFSITPTAVPPAATNCVPNYAYDNLVNEGQSWVVVDQQQNVNNTTSPETETFTVKASKTVTVTDEKHATTDLKVSGDALIATIAYDVKSEINHSVSEAVTVSVDNSTTLSVPPGQTGYANYGVRVQITNGHLYDKNKCEGNKSDLGMDITYTPIGSGWCTWLSNRPDPCPSL